MNEKLETNERLLRVPEAAKVAHVSPQTIYRKVAAGEVPAPRIGNFSGPIRIPEGEFRAWLYGDPRDAA
jgi:excisionase family DNA binding protein